MASTPITPSSTGAVEFDSSPVTVVADLGTTVVQNVPTPGPVTFVSHWGQTADKAAESAPADETSPVEPVVEAKVVEAPAPKPAKKAAAKVTAKKAAAKKAAPKAKG